MTGKRTTDKANALVSAGSSRWSRELGLDLVETRAHGAWIVDQNGDNWLDVVSGSNTFNLGRHNPALAAELISAMHDTDQGNFPMISVEKASLASALAETIGAGLECSVFGVNRGEAIDCACKLARGFTGRTELLSVQGAWHGETGFALSLSDRTDRTHFGPLVPSTGRIPFGDHVAAKTLISRQTAAVLIEPVQVENGARPVEAAWVRGLADICSRTGTLLVVDESQTGFGRTGSLVAFKSLEIKPDILVLGEALGAGMFPIAVTMLTQRVNEFVNKHPMIHLSTFGGSDLGCRVAFKALGLYHRTKPWESARVVGARLRNTLRTMIGQGDLGEVSGQGLVLGLHMGTRDRALALCRALAKQKVLALPGRVDETTVLLRPTLLLSEPEADHLAKCVERAL